MDYLEPLPNGKCYLVLIDQRSRYPTVAFTTSTDGTSLVKVLENVFAQYGLPDRVTTDNGPPFPSTNVHSYFKSKRIYHQKITNANEKLRGLCNHFQKLLKLHI